MPAPAPVQSQLPRRVLIAVYLVATCLSLLLFWRSQAGGDQLNLLARGWLLATQGELVPYGNPTSGGGVSPGPMTSLVMGLPLLLWSDARAPIVLSLLSHFLALLLLDRLVAGCWGREARLCFALLYGLSPLRLFLSGVLWNPSWLLLAGAVHAWTAYRQRSQGRAFDSFLHVVTVGLAAQLHLSVVILGAASVLLWWRKAIKVHWGGAIAGALVTGLSLVPYLLVLDEPRVEVPANGGFLGRGLLLVYPLAHGVWNGLRAAALSLPTRLAHFDFTEVAGPRVDALLTPLALFLAKIVAPLTLVVALVAIVRFLKRRKGRVTSRSGDAPLSDRRWLNGYALCCFIAALAVYGLSPTTPMWWQGVVLLHALVLPVTALGAALLRSRMRRRARQVAVAWAALAVLLGLAMAFGGPHFRCGGRNAVNLTLAESYPMLEELGLEQRCPYPIEAGGWYPDLFPPEQ